MAVTREILKPRLREGMGAQSESEIMIYTVDRQDFQVKYRNYMMRPTCSLYQRIRSLIPKTPSRPASHYYYLTKFKCHPTIPCNIPVFHDELEKVWYHLPTKILPKDWSCKWHEYQRLVSFLPFRGSSYSVGELDIRLSGIWGLSMPTKSVMYYRLAWRGEPGLSTIPHHERLVIQDALGDYYYHYEFCQGGDEFVAKFRAPRGTNPEDFVKNYFKGAVTGVDMDELPVKLGKRLQILYAKQRQLSDRWARAGAESRCACILRYFHEPNPQAEKKT